MNPIHLDYKNNQIFSDTLDKQLVNEGESVDIRSEISLWGNTKSSMKINIEHLKNKTKSYVRIRGVLKDEAKLEIFGNLHIVNDANDCDAFFEAKILLLGNKAKATVLPELKIDNRNVKARHAVVIKKISDDDLYFLQSRGIPLEKAKQDIIEGFLQ